MQLTSPHAPIPYTELVLSILLAADFLLCFYVLQLFLSLRLQLSEGRDQ